MEENKSTVTGAEEKAATENQETKQGKMYTEAE